MEHTLEEFATQVLVPTIAMTDGELLMRFAQHGDEQAFTAIVEKHGRLVWTVCWQVLREHHAIEDAFQSTFFILAKRARSIRSCDSLCGWLYRVAYRTALRSRTSNKTRLLSTLGAEADTLEEWSEFDEKLRSIEQDEQRASLLEELQALPEKYQQVLALCYLEGKTRRKIADELGCSLETVKGRLARGRQVLRHRLIRRGVSLSLAMAAMAIPAKVATAAVTPNLIGLTVTGATAWAAGALGAAKITSGVSVAKSTAATSAQVIHLAQQGIFAMTIASLTKPTIVVVALLGVVSGTLALGSGDASQGKGQTIDLFAAAEGNTTASQDLAVEPVVTVAKVEETHSDDDYGKKKNVEFAFAGEQKFEFAAEKQRAPAPHRSPQPVKVRTPTVPADVLINAMPPMSEVPVVAPLNVPIPRLNLKLQLKMAELETRVSQLQLESKELEIASFKAEGKKREELLDMSRRMLIEAEAEKLKIQLEQQKEQIKALEEALREQAEQVTKQGAKIAIDAEMVATRAEQAAGAAEAQTAMQAKEAAKQADTLRIQERVVYVDPNSGQPYAANAYPAVNALPVWEQSIEAQQGAMSLKPSDRILVDVVSKDGGFESDYTVEPMGTVALGATYGRAEVKGLSILEAEEVIADVIKKIMKDAKVQVTYLHPTTSYSTTLVPSRNATYPRYVPPATTKPIRPATDTQNQTKNPTN